MRIWLLKAGEPLPGSGTGDRLFRTGLLAGVLASRGHDVVWWTSTVDHVRKIQLAEASTRRAITDRYALWLLRGPMYRKNKSPMRFINHRVIANEFQRLAATEPSPDVIVCSLPTVEFAGAAVRYGRRHGVPVVIDIRDLWPDIVVHLMPPWLRAPARLGLWWMYAEFREAVREATAVCGISDSAVEWAIARSGRQRRPADRTFPHAYMSSPPDTAAAAAASARLDALGVGAADGTFRACFMGNLSSRLELPTVVDAARRLSATHRQIQFVLAGQGEMLAPLKAQAAGLANVVLPGWLGAAELVTLMERSHVGLLPYPDEPDLTKWPTNKVGEYFSRALPIVSSVPGDVAALLATHQCGITYRNGDAAELAAILARLGDDHAGVEAMSRRAAALFDTQFKGEVVYNRFADFIEEQAA